MPANIIPSAIKFDLYGAWYKGRDCGPRSGPESSAKAPRGISDGPAGAVRQGRTGVRHEIALKVSTFRAISIRSIFS